jgi:hypothetical protein
MTKPLYPPCHLSSWCGVLSGVVLSAVCPYPGSTHKWHVGNQWCHIVCTFWCRNVVFLWDVRFENYPSLQFHNDFIYWQMFRRDVKFWEVYPSNLQKSLAFSIFCHNCYLSCQILSLYCPRNAETKIHDNSIFCHDCYPSCQILSLYCPRNEETKIRDNSIFCHDCYPSCQILSLYCPRNAETKIRDNIFQCTIICP